MQPDEALFQRTVRLSPDGSLHMRPIAALVRIAAEYCSTIHLRCGDRTANAKSWNELLLLSLEGGSELEIRCEGSDAQAAGSAVAHFLAGGDSARAGGNA